MGLNQIELESFAKINLHLDITGKLENGFHKLYSVFQLIDLSDRITIKIKNTENFSESERITINGDFDCNAENNLIYRIINDFEKKAGIKKIYEINVDKNIPAGGGLGGGSSNAAFVLANINRMCSNPLNEEQMLEIAEKNGSDIPFFLKAVTAVVKGRGEAVYPVEADLSDYEVVITCPDFKISTKDAFDLFDNNKINGYKSFEYSEEEMSALLKKKPDEWGFFNSFTPVLSGVKPVFNEIFQIFNETGSEYYNITGSGSAVYGIFRKKDDSEKAKEKLKKILPFVWNGKMLAGKPLLDL